MKHGKKKPGGHHSRPKFIFLAHWVEPWTWLLRFVPDLHDHPEKAGRYSWMAPAYLPASAASLFSWRNYEVVDRFDFAHGLRGETWLLPNYAWHFALPRHRDRIRERILNAALDAQASGAKVLGLGALTKDETLTRGGSWIVEKAGSRLKIPIVHGDTLTAHVVVLQAIEILARHKHLQHKPCGFRKFWPVEFQKFWPVGKSGVSDGDPHRPCPAPMC